MDVFTAQKFQNSKHKLKKTLKCTLAQILCCQFILCKIQTPFLNEAKTMYKEQILT